MECTIVKYSDIVDRGKNPNLCLSPLRYFNSCQKCETFRNTIKRGSRSIKEIVETMKCKPNFDMKATNNYLKALKEYDEIAEKLKQRREEMGW